MKVKLIISFYIVIFALVNIFAPSTDYISDSKEILSLNDTSDIRGSSFIFAGSVNETPVFWYYQKENGLMELKSINTKLALIKYTKGTPSIDTYNRRYNLNWLNKVFFCTDNYAKILRIPEGSIVEDYTLNTDKK